MTVQTARTVFTENGKVNLYVMSTQDKIPQAFTQAGANLEKQDRYGLRIAGGCSRMSEEDVAKVLPFFENILQGARGVVWSGATRSIGAKGEVSPMVTEVPALVAAQNPNVIAIGTAPRTGVMHLIGESSLMLDQWNAPNPGMSAILVVQDGPEVELDWDGDVDTYFKVMDAWKRGAQFHQVGLIGFNGGPTTRKEVLIAIEKGYPVVLIEGSGRECGETIPFQIKKGLLDDPHKCVRIGHIDDPELTRIYLQEFGFVV